MFITESLPHLSTVYSLSAVLCDLAVQQMREGLPIGLGKQHALLPGELPEGNREDYLQVGFFKISHVSNVGSLSAVLFYAKNYVGFDWN